MPGNPKVPEIGELHVDASDCASFIVDLPPGALASLIGAREGVDLVVAEISANQVAFGERAGITKADIDQLVNAHARVEQIDVYLPAARKLVELLEETRATQDDLREKAIRAVARSVDMRARQPANTDLLAKYEETRIYRSELANRSAKARRKNAAEKAKGKADNGAPVNGSPGGQTPAPGGAAPA